MSQEEVAAKIVAQGDVVRELKASKADKAAVTAGVRAFHIFSIYHVLPGRKAEGAQGGVQDGIRCGLRTSGHVFAPRRLMSHLAHSNAAAAPKEPAKPKQEAKPKEEVPKATEVVSAAAVSADEAAAGAKIEAQGNVVRELKAIKGDKNQISIEVNTLKALKTEFKAKFGKEHGAAPVPAKEEPKKEDAPAEERVMPHICMHSPRQGQEGPAEGRQGAAPRRARGPPGPELTFLSLVMTQYRRPRRPCARPARSTPPSTSTARCRCCRAPSEQVRRVPISAIV